MKIIFYTAPWCGACKASHHFLDGIEHNEVDVSTPEGMDQGIAANVSSLPTITVIDDAGEEIYRHVGIFGRSDVEEMLDAERGVYA